VYSYKEGLLSAIAHDLKLRVERFEIGIEHETRQISARFDASSLRVVCAMKNGLAANTSLNAKDRAEIEANIIKEVLDAQRHPFITFESSTIHRVANGYQVGGSLKIRGKERLIEATANKLGGELVLKMHLNQPDYGIRVFSAALGALRIRPEVLVELCVPAELEP